MSFQQNAFQQNAFQVGVGSASAASPVIPVDMPLPARPVTSFAAGTMVSVNLLVTVLATTTVFRQPLIVPRNPAPRAAVVEQPPNLLTSTLATVQQNPFSQSDWPLPQQRATPRATADPPNITALQSTVLPIGRQTELLLPTVRTVRHTDIPPNLLTETLAAPFRQAEWPLARRAEPLRTEQSVNLLASMLVFDYPVGKQSLPEAATRRPAVASDIAPNLLTTTLAVVQTAPTAQYDWPLSQRRSVRPSEQIVNVLPLFAPIGSQSFDAASIRRPFVSPNVPPNLLTSTLATAPTLPPGEQSLPEPAARLRAVPFDQPPDLVTSTLFVAPPALPVGKQSLPEPAGRLRAVRFEQPPNLATTTLFTTPSLPPGRWLEPPTVLRNQVRHTDIPPNLLTSGFALHGPFRQFDWPLPQRRKFVHPEPQVINLHLTTFFKVPFRQTEWPLPYPKWSRHWMQPAQWRFDPTPPPDDTEPDDRCFESAEFGYNRTLAGIAPATRTVAGILAGQSALGVLTSSQTTTGRLNTQAVLGRLPNECDHPEPGPVTASASLDFSVASNSMYLGALEVL